MKCLLLKTICHPPSTSAPQAIQGSVRPFTTQVSSLLLSPCIQSIIVIKMRKAPKKHHMHGVAEQYRNSAFINLLFLPFSMQGIRIAKYFITNTSFFFYKTPHP